MKELINLRNVREKHFSKPDGTIEARLYDENVHYLKDGEYREIDNTIIKEKTFYENKDNDFKVVFPNTTENTLYRVEKNDCHIECALNFPKSKRFFIETDKNTLFMKNLTENMDAKYDIVGSKLKESLILKSYTDDDIVFVLNTDADLVLKKGEILGLKKDKTVFQMATPFMVSSVKEHCNNVYYELKKNDNEYILTIKLDHEWLKHQEYPVIIDPTINGDSTNLVEDTFIFEGDTDLDRNSLNYLKIGVDKDNKIYRSLLKFDLPTIRTGSQIISAKASLVTHTADYVFVSPDNPNIETREKITVHEITQPWTEENANWNTMHDKFSNKIESYTEFFRCERELTGEQNYIPRINSMDITSLAKKWYSGAENNGIMIKFLNEVYNPDCKEYYMISKNNESPEENNPRPFITINYRNQTGLLGYLSYNILSFKNGTSHINLYNGNVTNIFAINNTMAGKFPASLELVYNTNDVVLNRYKNGWRFSLEEKLKLENIDGKEYISYLDSTSNTSYFYKVEEPREDGSTELYYKDEDGQNLRIEPTEEGYKLLDKEGNEKQFVLLNDELLLSKIIDLEKNEINLTYDSMNRLIKVTDSNAQEINITYIENTITVISDHKTTNITFSDNKVMYITTKKGTTTFEYDVRGLISKVKDSQGLGIKYEYYDSAPYRIRKVEELGLQDSLGKSFSYEYGFNTTEITDEKNHNYVYTFNDQGNTIGTTIMDKSGSLKDSYGYNQRFVEAYGNNLNNKKTSETSPMKFADTSIERWSFEDISFGFSAQGGQVTDEISRTNNYSYKGQDSRTHDTVSVSYNSLGESDTDAITTITISGYIKSSNPVTVNLKRLNTLRIVPLDTTVVPASDKFTRFSFTCNKPESVGQPIMLDFYSEGDYYLADFQVDRGKVASPFNIVKNPEFKNETLIGWSFDEGAISNNEVERVSLPNGEYALKLNSHPDKTINATYSVNYEGKKGDVYNLSFWYKNEGVLDDELEFVGNAVTLQFLSTNEQEGAGTWNAKLNHHDTKWQFFSESFVAESDYSSFNLNVMSMFEANSLYITDIMLIKEMGQFNYSYDDEGNIISMADLAGNKSQMNYNSNNQLIGAFTPKGNRFSYEYDNLIASRVLKGISPTGISNEIEYDKYGNPVRTIINNTNPNGKIVNGSYYYMRLKGTKKYLDYDFKNNNLIFKECNCNHKTLKVDIIDIPEEAAYYRFTLLNKFLAVNGTNISLQTNASDNTLFLLTKKNNGSYCLTPKSKQTDNISLKYGKLVLEIANDDDYNQQFYFEDFGTDKFIETTATYTEDGRYITSKTDALGKTVTYDIDPVKGLTNSTTDAKGSITNYTYNAKDQMTSVTNNEKTVTYEYNDQDQLSKITSGTKNYTFTYDDFLNSETVKINDNTLITNTYEEKNGNLLSSTYGNGHNISYTYDDFDRLKTTTNSEKTYTNYYNAIGQLSVIEADKETHQYYYDFANRLSDYVLDNLSVKFKENLAYDENGNIKNRRRQLISTMGIIENTIDHSSEISYEYNEDDSVVKVTFDEGTLNYTYDYLGRLKNKNISSIYNIEYKYFDRGDKTSLIVKSLKVGEDKYDYKYDDLYNITDIYLNGELTNHYEYDELNELLRDDNYIQNITYKYTYDSEGNIISKKEYMMETNNLIKQDTFEYGNPLWEDQLTKYNDEEITYDEIGNPIAIGDKTLVWTNGRQLKTFNHSGSTINYKYDKDGTRTSKTIGTSTHSYYHEGTDIVLEKRDADMLYFIRDDVGSLIGMKYNEDMYYYIKNLQEDIIGIMNANFDKVASYEYDAWGKVLSIKDANGVEITDLNHIAHINPFRYRSYYYDEETELYYLKSRYYNPSWGRFLNVDTYLGVNKSVLGYNLYNYVNNNPVNSTDDSGEFFKEAWNWVKEKASKVKKTVCNIYNNVVSGLKSTINNVKSVINNVKNGVTDTISTLKKNVLIEVETGFGMERSIGVGNKKIGGGVSKSFGFRYSNGENKSYSSTMGGVTAGDLVDYSLEIRNYDDGTTNPMTIFGDNTKISGSFSAIIDKGGYFTASDDSEYATVSFSWFQVIGIRVKVGWKI